MQGDAGDARERSRSKGRGGHQGKFGAQAKWRPVKGSKADPTPLEERPLEHWDLEHSKKIHAVIKLAIHSGLANKETRTEAIEAWNPKEWVECYNHAVGESADYNKAAIKDVLSLVSSCDSLRVVWTVNEMCGSFNILELATIYTYLSIYFLQ